MAITLNGSTGIETPTINGTAEHVTSVTEFKNRIINGGFTIDQRNAGASQTITAAAALAYTTDRWYAYCTGANVTGQQIAGTYASSKNRYQFTGAASVTAIGLGQRIEASNSYDLANTTATLSCYISNSLLTSVTWTAYYATTTADTFGSLASPTVTQIATGTFTVSSTRTQYTTNISIPSAATTGIQIVFSVGAQTSGTWIIDSVQLEKGSTATSFDYRPYGTELSLCQRYYEKSYDIGVVPATATTAGSCGSSGLQGVTSTTEVGQRTNFAVTKRATPTILIWDGNGNSNKVDRVQAGVTNNYNSTFSGTNNVGTNGFNAYSGSGATCTSILYHYTASAEL